MTSTSGAVFPRCSCRVKVRSLHGFGRHPHKALDDLTLCACAVTVGSTPQALGVVPPLIKYLRVCLTFSEDFFVSFQVRVSSRNSPHSRTKADAW